jgi:hypothetical protein
MLDRDNRTKALRVNSSSKEKQRMKQLRSGDHRISGGFTVLSLIAGLVALAAGLAVTTGTASAQEVDEEATVEICVDGETMAVTAAELAEIEEEFTEGACEEATDEEGTSNEGATGDALVESDTDDGIVEEGATDGDSAADEGATGDDVADEGATDDDASEEDASEASLFPDPHPNLVPQEFETRQLPQSQLPSAGATEEIISAPDDDESLAAEEEPSSEVAAGLPSTGSGGLAGGGAAPWGALLAGVLFSLGGAAALVTRTGLR